MSMWLVSFILIAVSTPPPNAGASPPVITTVKASSACSVLKKNVYAAVGGMLANDNLVSQGKQLVAKSARDASADPENGAATGGAGASSALDDVRLAQLVLALADNLRKIDTELDNASAFPSNRPTDARLADIHAALRNVLAAQRRELDVLSAEADTNQAMDLASRRNPIVGASFHAPVAMRINERLPLSDAIQLETFAEHAASPAITQLAAACR